MASDLLARLATGDWAGKLLRIALVAATSAGAALLLVPASSRRLPGLEALGTPAPATIKADRDYDIVDEVATAHRQVGPDAWRSVSQGVGRMFCLP